MKKVRLFLLVVCLWLAAVGNGFCQAPANDNFANATVLTGDNIVFTGSLAGATVESNEVYGLPFGPGYGIYNSVWWSWTATKTEAVTLMALSYSLDTWTSGRTQVALAVYSITNDLGISKNQFGNVTNPPALAGMLMPSSVKDISITFNATAGSNYQIQFYSPEAESVQQVTFQLIATNKPVIIEQPADQSIAPNGSAFFSIIVAGVEPFSYQWCSNGVAINGETNPMLALDYVTTNQAGDYTVVVSNATGVVTSQAARLMVNPDLAAPMLIAESADTNGLVFNVVGESGRYWRIESSTNLVTWVSENDFLPSQDGLITFLPYALNPTYYDVILSTNTLTSVSVPQSGGYKYIRARAYAVPDGVCNNNLKRIRFAKQLWGRDTSRNGAAYAGVGPRNDTPTWEALEAYGVEVHSLVCPVGGSNSYDSGINPEIFNPTCKVPGHILEEPR